ncbi:MAG: large ribosomal subunit protein uL5, partial [bacterium]
MGTFKDKYFKEIMPQLKEEFGYKNDLQVPKITKVIINMGVGEAVQNAKTLDFSVSDLTAISGQKPVITRAKKSIAGFKLRKGMPIGCKVTLRRERMYDFLEKLMNVALPRIRDFKG